MKSKQVLVAQVRRMVEVENMQQHLVASALGLHRSTVGNWCKRFGIQTQRTGPRSGDLHPGWRGGRVLVGGYWYVYAPDHPHRTKTRRVAEHRLVMEAKLGRYLDRSEVVHHIDGDSQNNHPDNLQHFRTNADHLSHELKGRIPRWTEGGIARIEAGVRKAAAIHRRIKSDDDLRILSTARPRE